MISTPSPVAASILPESGQGAARDVLERAVIEAADEARDCRNAEARARFVKLDNQLRAMDAVKWNENNLRVGIAEDESGRTAVDGHCQHGSVGSTPTPAPDFRDVDHVINAERMRRKFETYEW